MERGRQQVKAAVQRAMQRVGNGFSMRAACRAE